PALQPKPITQAIKNTSVDPSHSLEAFPANVSVMIQFNLDPSASAVPYSEPLQIQKLDFRLFQCWTFEFEKTSAQFRSSENFRHFLFRHPDLDVLPRFDGDPIPWPQNKNTTGQ